MSNILLQPKEKLVHNLRDQSQTFKSNNLPYIFSCKINVFEMEKFDKQQQG